MEVPGVRQPAVVIETTPVEQLLQELLACNSRIGWATEEKVEVLREATRGFRKLAAVWAKYLERNGEEEWEGGNGAGEEQRKMETERGMEAEVHMEEGNGAGVTEETEKEEQTEGKGKEKATEAEMELDVVGLEGGLEDGVGEETLDAE
jgi:hypothetical protein